MINLLVQYFIKNGHISLPGIGSLKITKNESYWDDGKLIAPNEYIQLDHKNFEQINNLINYIADELDVTQAEANNQFNKFLEQILSQQIASLNFGNLGTFYKNGANITWNGIYKSDDYFNNITPDLYYPEEEDSKSSTQNDYSWLIWSLLIFIISIALIFYKNISQ